jgi:cytochrome P450
VGVSNFLSAQNRILIFYRANSNAIPAAYWFLYEIFRDPELLRRVRHEVDGARLNANEPDALPRFDLELLIKSPLLQSIYAETLRLQTAILIARMPAREDYQLGEYSFKKDKLLVAASYIAHHDPKVWNQGTVEDPHPLNKFWAERFLIKPDQDHSGPVLQSYRSRQVDGSTTTRPGPPARVDSVMQPSSPEPEVKYSTDGLAGAWVPYGGGQSLCPGRHYAKQEMLMTFAIMSTCFDIEILQEPGEVTLPDLGYFGLGVLPPKNKTRCRIRRRVIRKDSVVGGV